MKNRITHTEKQQNGVCKEGLAIKNCRHCLFEALCTFKENQRKIEKEYNKE